MTPYYAHVCILGWKTKLIWGVLIFFAQKNYFSFSYDQKWFFGEAPTKNMLQKWNIQIYKNIVPYFMDNIFSWQVVQGFSACVWCMDNTDHLQLEKYSGSCKTVLCHINILVAHHYVVRHY
jgi:hypothetical protein